MLKRTVEKSASQKSKSHDLRLLTFRLAIVCFVLFSFSISLSLSSLAQSNGNDIDTDTAVLQLIIGRSVSLQLIGGPIQATITPADTEKRFFPLGSLQLIVGSLVNYRVAAFGEVVSTGDVRVQALQLRVGEVLGLFDLVLATEFMDLGGPGAPIGLFEGGNNAGARTVARVDLQLDLADLGSNVQADVLTFTVTFTVVERG